MNRLDMIRATVAAHFALQTEHDELLEASAEIGESLFDGDSKWIIWETQHTAMMLLRDLLPLLNAVVKWTDASEGTDAYYMLAGIIDTEVCKLFEEVES